MVWRLSSFLSFISSPWTRGLCIGEAGNNCRLRHFYRPLEADFPPSGVTTRAPELVEFSSPLVVKVRKEVAKERREELDLETGTRRSWVESREFDVLDLTGLDILYSLILFKITGQDLSLLSTTSFVYKFGFLSRRVSSLKAKQDSPSQCQ